MDKGNLTAQQFSFANIVGEDDYGRKVTVRNVTDKKDVYVGVFYSAWLGSHMDANCGRILDVDKMEKDNPDELFDRNKDIGIYHFASEPLYGYYSMRDEWVVNRHVELLTLSGIDYLMFDNTNHTVYSDVTHLVAKTLLKYQSQGWKVPKIAFYTNADSRKTIQKLYDEFYIGKPEYDSIWLRFAGDSRPVIVGVSDKNYVQNQDGKSGYSSDWPQYEPQQSVDSKSELYNYFNFFESQWPNMLVNKEYGFPWMSTWHKPPVPNLNGNIATSVNKHSWYSVFSSSKFNNASRGHNGKNFTRPSGKNPDWKKGDNLEWQLISAKKHIKKGTATNLIITGWNEWIACKMNSDSWGVGFKVDPRTNKEIFFVDTYNAEYSRDLEMGKAYGDGFYLQLLRHAREIKYGKVARVNLPTKTISNIKDFSLWDDVKTEYADFVGDAIARDGENAVRIPHSYIDKTNRNDIASVKVVCDSKYAYLLVTTKDDITEHQDGDKYWMNVMIASNDADSNKFIGFDYVINRKPQKDGTTSIERCNVAYSYSWEDAGKAEYYVNGNKIAYKIPLASIGIKGKVARFNFKVCDNVAKPTYDKDYNVIKMSDPEKLDYYVYGDSAPIGTLGFAYNKK